MQGATISECGEFLAQGRASPRDLCRLSVVSAWVIVCGHAGPRGIAQMGAKATARRLVSALVNETAHGHWVGPRRVGVPDRLTSRAGTEK